MSSTDSSSEASPFVSENEYESEFDEICDVESGECSKSIGQTSSNNAMAASSDNNDSYAWADDPVADDEWTENYEEEMRQQGILQETLMRRLDGSTQLLDWCKCGNCRIEYLTNWQECQCCSELDGCKESLSTDIVQKELNNEAIKCITQHPGFRPVCLERWSLRMAAWQYKTKGKERYKQRADEESFLRSVAYREFIRMVYGILGRRRILLPACAYHEIRKTFPVAKDRSFTGFEMDEDDV